MISVKELAKEAKKASKELSLVTTEQKNTALKAMAKKIRDMEVEILRENEKDLVAGKEKGYDQALLDRLALTSERIEGMAKGLEDLTNLTDPVGNVVSNWTLDNGLDVEKVTVPLGVIGMIYEARPNVTVDATGIALKSGNAIVLKGGSSAIHSNRAIVAVLHEALEETDIPKDAVQFINTTDRSATQELFTMNDYVDVLIPRGGGKLIQTVVQNATVPVLETGVGNCHIYVDEFADVTKALSIVKNAKTDRPAVCNAAETLIVHEKWLEQHKEDLQTMLDQNDIELYGDQKAMKVLTDVLPAGEEDWSNEYLRKAIAVKVVSSLDEAVDHIEKYGTKHSEAIVTEDGSSAERFMALVDAAALYHNASTRFTDGSALGFGAEIGISTQKLHARGPMGLPEMTTIKFKMRGNGQVR
ncbi:glutamate-5-semialdehyde dehydrogenase [Mangrovibacillus cuniculi]|uniref:Gamma-glutamyl phosphate reductase n=1 Tax=Mangrovibacillus cuniculi TaxID=2593652 RepID=A0A7S8CAP5_9BACI|nr:glutamate-5-semialdehyde dehydrogenase [Mangrovibacillus cuniculi]QPC46514.1 glutamate-5-semialdehyde dehydrogenase [Mangrovibacillus cuniculi]